jgi:hypothetical protein
MTATPTRLADLAAATPDTRDRAVDAIRAAAILAVVLGHWLIAVITWDGDGIHAGNALSAVPGLRWLTWAFQVMPLFFVVGGFANRAALLANRRKGLGAADYLRTRTLRLTAAVLPLAATWAVAGPVLERTVGLPPQLVKVIAQPLWFLAVYLVVSSLAPLTLRLHERFGLRVVAVLAAVALADDVVRLPYLNYVVVFVAAHQLGYAFADGTLARLDRRRLVAIAAAALVALLVLTGPGPYPRSMVGVPGERLSNMSPPTICILVLGVLQVALVQLVRARLTRALQRPAAWSAVIAVNASIMTIFLWHLTALAVGAVVLLHPASPFPQPEPGTAAWWLTRLPWLVTLAAVLAAIVAAAGRAERRSHQGASDRAGTAMAAAVVATIAAGAGLTAFALSGFGGATAVAAMLTLYFSRRMLIG